MPSPSSLIAACRRLALHRQGLASAQPFGRGVAGTLRAIEHLGYVQIDTISVIERAHHHVLWSRVPAYRPAHLARLLQTRQVFEYWFHAAAYLPMRDYRFALPRMAQVRRDGHMWFDDADPRLMHEIMAQVRAEGPQRLRDLGRLAGESRAATPAVSVPVPQLDMAVAPGNEPSATTGNGNGDSSGTESDTAVAAAASDTGADTDTDATDITAAVAAPAGTVDTSLSGAWNWKPLRRALDTLFMRGELMICARQGMEKVYDLAERVLPADVDTRPPSIDEQALHLLDNGLRAHGIVTLPQVAHLRPGKPLRDSLRAQLAARVADGALRSLRLADGSEAFVECDALESLPRRLPATIRLLSPFDNLVIHRERLAALFGFDYRLECYLPPHRRVHGYFCLPILWGERFIGRVDCKAHRARGLFEVLRLHLDVAPADRHRVAIQLTEALMRLAAFNGCAQLKMAD